MGWFHLKIFSRTTEPEELKFPRKLSDIMWIQGCSNHEGREGAEEGKSYLHVFMFLRKIFSRTDRIILIKLRTKSLGEVN
jgi:hypothetical protein